MGALVMFRRRMLAGVALAVAIMDVQTLAAPFVVFPKAGQLASPNGRFVVRSSERESSASEFAGTFHALWLTELSSGRSRKLCDYVGVAAVAWAGDDFLVVTEYVAKKTSRALVFSLAALDQAVLVDVPTMIQIVSVDLRDSLRNNDHVFVEASSLEGETLHLHVWGYGRHDPNGFRWKCNYQLRNGAVSCRSEHR